MSDLSKRLNVVLLNWESIADIYALPCVKTDSWWEAGIKHKELRWALHDGLEGPGGEGGKEA